MQLGCHYIIDWKNCRSGVTPALGPCPAPTVPVCAQRRSSPRVKPHCLHPRHPARLWRAPHVGRAPPRVPGPAGAGRGLLGPGRPCSACASKHSLVFCGWDEARRCLTKWRCFLGMRIFLRACNKTNCRRQK